MSNKINRRSFLTNTALGVGAVALSSSTWPFTNITNHSISKKLIATTDYNDNIGINLKGSRYGKPVPRSEEYYANHKCFMDKKQLDELHQVLASFGVTRHQWIVDTFWAFYEDYPHGFNLLEEAANSAHKYGIEFIAEIKPFEGGGLGTILPHSLPVPEGTAVKDIRGVIPFIRPFVAQNPHLCLKCKSGEYEYKSQLKNIRLVKRDNKLTRIKGQHLSIFSSETNNKFVQYNGTVTFRESVESRFVFSLWKECRVLHLEGLQLPKNHKYVLIKCSLADDDADFWNEKGSIIELEGEDGKNIPHQLGEGPVPLKNYLNSFYKSRVSRETLRYLKNPEVLSEIEDINKMQEHYRDFYDFDSYTLTRIKTLDKDGYIVVSLGKPEYLIGNLHPIYPEVRKHWLDLTHFCLDAGVDGINYRVANHAKLPYKWDYGFNDKVLQSTNGNTNLADISKVNGDAYTQFLLEARELIKSRGKKLIHHLHAAMLMPDDRGKTSSLPPNFEWQWEKWVNEIADELEFRGGFMMRPWNLNKILDTFSSVTKQAGKPFYYQGDFHGMSFDRPVKVTEEELKFVDNHPGLDGYVLYETANFTRINEDEEIEGSPKIDKLLKNYRWEK